MKKTISIGIIILTLVIPAISQSNKNNKEVKNVILMIGDGMGIAQIYAAMTENGMQLNMTQGTQTGITTTYSADKYITDSGAAGTAISTGVKTKNGSIAVDTAGNKLKTILEYCEDKGMVTGLISTSSITHATPASFIAHQANRGSYEDIASDFLKTDIEVFIGGGLDHFKKRKDGKDLTLDLTKKGYTVIEDQNQVINFKGKKLAALTAAEHHKKMTEGRGDMLPESTEKAIEILNTYQKGFFLMVEGSQIDWAGHDNDSEYNVAETIDFDKAVGKALAFARKDGNTLVIITADHETGGMTITGGNIEQKESQIHFSTKDHSAIPVMLFAYGPGSETFSGFYDNTDIIKKILPLLKINEK